MKQHHNRKEHKKRAAPVWEQLLNLKTEEIISVRKADTALSRNACKLHSLTAGGLIYIITEYRHEGYGGSCCNAG